MNAMHAMLDTSVESTIRLDSAKNQDAQVQLYSASTGLKGHLGSNTVRVLQLDMHQGTGTVLYISVCHTITETIHGLKVATAQRVSFCPRGRKKKINNEKAKNCARK